MFTGLSECLSLKDDDYGEVVVVQGHGCQLHRAPLRDQKQTHPKKLQRVTVRKVEYSLKNSLVAKIMLLIQQFLRVEIQKGRPVLQRSNHKT